MVFGYVVGGLVGMAYACGVAAIRTGKPLGRVFDFSLVRIPFPLEHAGLTLGGAWGLNALYEKGDVWRENMRRKMAAGDLDRQRYLRGTQDRKE